jgi:hypothetical protein
MRFIVGKIPENEDFKPEEEGWNKIKEPSNLWVTQLLAIPFIFVNIIFVVFLAFIFSVQLTFEVSILFIAALLLMLPIHEFLHAVVFPDKLSSDKIYFGIMPKQMAFFAFYTGIISKRRFLLSLMTPLMTITVIGLITMKIVGDNALIGNILLINALAACGDSLNFFIMLFQVPKNARLRNKGILSYWKMT